MGRRRDRTEEIFVKRPTTLGKETYLETGIKGLHQFKY